MLIAAIQLPNRSAALGLLGGVVLLYAAAQAILAALVAPRSPAPGKRAVAQFVPVAATALVATLMRRADLAVGIVFATAVSALALGIGAVATIAPADIAPTSWRRAWPFVLPAGMLALLAGFSAQLNWIHAMILTVEGLVVLALWMDKSIESPVAAPVAADASVAMRNAGWSAMELLLGIGLAVLGAFLTARATISASEQLRVLGGTVAATVVLGPGLILPILGSGTTLASEGRSAEAMTAYVGLSLLNLCLLLPMVIVVGYLTPGIHEVVAALRHATTMPGSPLGAIAEKADAIAFPLAVWRVDTVLLVALGLMLLPAALGRWPLGRREGVGMILGYWAYLLVAVALANH
jgi:Ca2+/Na+ antiporter